MQMVVLLGGVGMVQLDYLPQLAQLYSKSTITGTNNARYLAVKGVLR